MTSLPGSSSTFETLCSKLIPGFVSVVCANNAVDEVLAACAPGEDSDWPEVAWALVETAERLTPSFDFDIDEVFSDAFRLACIEALHGI